MHTLAELLVARAASHPDRGFRFVHEGPDDVLSYRDLDRDARQIASTLIDRGVAPGSRALLAYPPGLDLVRAFWACVYAGVIAVPVPAPHPQRLDRTLPRLRGIAADCRPALVMTTTALAASVPELRVADLVIGSDACTGDPTWEPRPATPEDVVLLQYTSGSTREPRGVVLSNANVVHNLGLLREFHMQQDHMVLVHWLPLYHDMGLVRGMLSPVHMGGDCVMLSPMRFVERPVRWLSAVTAYRATTIGAPNFGFELCVRKITDAELATLDLSSLRLVFASAEPNRKTTIDRFLARFAACGLDPSAFRPAYGLAEATVAVAGERAPGYRHWPVSAAALRTGQIAPPVDDADRYDLVSCGPPLGDQDVVIVDDEQRAASDRIGEVWVRGPSVGRGYWGSPQATATTFGAYLRDGTGPFLRTGDLGWRGPDGGLAIVGRMKDVLVIRGETFHPQDLEAAAESASPFVRPGCSAAFAIDSGESEVPVIVTELRGDVDDAAWRELVVAIRAAISKELGLALAAIVGVAPGTLPKTASGKIQRSATRALYERGALTVRRTWHHPPAT